MRSQRGPPRETRVRRAGLPRPRGRPRHGGGGRDHPRPRASGRARGEPGERHRAHMAGCGTLAGRAVQGLLHPGRPQAPGGGQLGARGRPLRDRGPDRVEPAAAAAAVTTVWTIGYESLWPDALVAALSAARVERVLDVRYRPQSRRPGMSKTKLGLKLAEHGMSYEHRRELGTPVGIRGLFRSGHLDEACATYRAHAVANAGEALDAPAA